MRGEIRVGVLRQESNAQPRVEDKGTGLQRGILMALNPLLLDGMTSSEISRLRGE